MEHTSTTLRGVTPPRPRPHSAARTRRRRAPEPGRLAARLLLCAHLLGVSALGACLWHAAPQAGLVTWAVLVVAHAGVLPFVADGRRRTGLTLLVALLWALGLAWLLPHADGLARGVMAAASFVLAATALPVMGSRAPAYLGYLAALGLPVALAIAVEGRQAAVLPWLLLATATVALAGALHAREYGRLRALLVRFLAADDDGARGVTPDDPELADRAALALDLAGSRPAARAVDTLAALGDAVLRCDAAGTIDYANPVAAVLLGQAADDLRGQRLEFALRLHHPPATHNQVHEIFARLRESGRAQIGPDDATLTRRDGIVHGVDYVATAIRSSDGGFAGAGFVLRDVTARRQRAEHTAWRARHDVLTGAINRGEFEQRLQALLRRVARSDGQNEVQHGHALLYIDVDHFKRINDGHGHAAGDHALRRVGEILRGRIRGADTLARVGGDEFAALLYACTPDKARLIAEGLRAAVERQPVSWQDGTLGLTVSIGVATIAGPSATAGAVLRAADQACYRAKSLGRNRVEIDHGEAASAAVADLDALEHVLATGRLVMSAATLAAAADVEGSACEVGACLIGVVGAGAAGADLDHLAERSHRRAEVDRWLVDATLAALATAGHPLAGHDFVVLPLSDAGCGSEALRCYIDARLRAAPALAPRLAFAFADASLLGGADYARYFAGSLKQHGCRLMLGDLGFGSAALALARSLQADLLGIDGTLTAELLSDSTAYEAVLGLSRIARSLGMRTVALHAPGAPLRDALFKMGIDYVRDAPTPLPAP